MSRIRAQFSGGAFESRRSLSARHLYLFSLNVLSSSKAPFLLRPQQENCFAARDHRAFSPLHAGGHIAASMGV